MNQAPVPRPASTVLLVRDAPAPGSGVEVFMERRHTDSAFVGGAYVFPGGRVDPEDAVDPELCVGLGDAEASRQLGMAEGGLAHFVAAIRECYEEAGILLAYDQAGALLDFADPAVEEHFRELRARMNAGQVTLARIAERERLRLATDRLAYWSHWITPVGEPRRYDTRFFIAEAPERQVAAHDDWELTTSAWIAPRDAIARALRREWTIIYPTLMNLKVLAAQPSAQAAVAWAARQPRPLPANLPRALGGRVVLPGDPGYERAESDFSGLDPGIFERSFDP